VYISKKQAVLLFLNLGKKGRVMQEVSALSTFTYPLKQ